jgi:hypothetical protein
MEALYPLPPLGQQLLEVLCRKIVESMGPDRRRAFLEDLGRMSWPEPKTDFVLIPEILGARRRPWASLLLLAVREAAARKPSGRELSRKDIFRKWEEVAGVRWIMPQPRDKTEAARFERQKEDLRDRLWAEIGRELEALRAEDVIRINRKGGLVLTPDKELMIREYRRAGLLASRRGKGSEPAHRADLR